MLSYYLPPSDVMELLSELRYYDKEAAFTRLKIVARYADDPVQLKKLQERWLYLYDRNMLN